MIRHNPGVDITVISDREHIGAVGALLNRLAVTGISAEVYEIEADERISEVEVDALLQKAGAGLLLGSTLKKLASSELLNRGNYSLSFLESLEGINLYIRLQEVYRQKLGLNRSWKDNIHLVDQEWETI